MPDAVFRRGERRATPTVCIRLGGGFGVADRTAPGGGSRHSATAIRNGVRSFCFCTAARRSAPSCCRH